MTHVTCRLTAKNRDQLRNPTRGNRVWTTFTFFVTDVAPRRSGRCSATPKFADSRRTLPRTGGRERSGTSASNSKHAVRDDDDDGQQINPGRTDGRAGGPGSLGGGVSELDTAQFPGVPRACVLAFYRSRSVTTAARSGARPALRVSSATDLNPGWVIAAEFH